MTRKKAAPNREDGRRNNRTPEKSRIKPKEVRNPWGRGGKPKAAASPDEFTKIDALYLAQANRIVSQDKNGQITALERLVMEDVLSAFGDKTGVRRREVIERMEQAQVRGDRNVREFLDWLRGAQEDARGQFRRAKLMGHAPPDIAHPDHIVVEADWFRIVGPLDREGRKHWESLKSMLRLSACEHKILREEARKSGSPKVLEELRQQEKWRRRMMRKVPKGWNWREEIECRDSQLEITKKVCARMEELGYVDLAD